VSLGNYDGDNANVKTQHALMSKTMTTLHVHYTFWYISPPSFAKQQRVMARFKVFWRTGTHDGEFCFLFLNLSTVPTNSVPGQFGYIR